MGTTPKGYPYPEPTDPIAAGADAIRALAETVDTKNGATVWTAITAAAGWSTAGMWWRKVGDIVYLIGSISGTTTGTTAFTLPTGARPTATVYVPLAPIVSQPPAASALATIQATGVVVIHTTNLGNTSIQCSFSTA